jgi:threonine aldolase
MCRRRGIKLHLDGARIFNALQESGDTPGETGKYFDSISVCLSKGLGAPVGSLLLGDVSFIKHARRVRKVFGGGMRQAGVIAAAGLYALRNNITRLKEDHRRAALLGEALKQTSFVESQLPVYTNIIIFNLRKEHYSGEEFEKRLALENIRISSFGKQTIRMVTHLDFTDEMLEHTLRVLKSL